MPQAFELFGPRVLPIVRSVMATGSFIVVNPLATGFLDLRFFESLRNELWHTGDADHDRYGSFVECMSNVRGHLKLFWLGGFFHAYFVLGTADLSPSLGYSSLLATFRLGVLGDFDLSELEGTDEGGELYTYSHIWFYLASLIVTMLMMNILVGILGSNYDRFEDQSKQLFVQKRAEVIMAL